TRFSRDWSSDVCSSDLTLNSAANALASQLRKDIAELDGEHVVRRRIQGRGEERRSVARSAQQGLVVTRDQSGIRAYVRRFDAHRSEERRVGKEGRPRRR